MPEVFETPDSPAPPGQTRIRGFSGKGALFEGTRGIGLEEVTDGTSNTVLVASARDAVPWTQPAELPFVGGQSQPALDRSDPQGYVLGMCDGSVRLLPRSEERILPAMITRAGGEVIPVPPVGGQPTINTSVTTITPLPTPPLVATLPPRPEPTPAPMGAVAVMPLKYGPASPLATELHQRLQRVEEKLDRVLQKLDRLSSDGKPAQR
jgi:hypothetical protein